jgi:membrane-associated phospholipid phosphatase
VKEKLRSFIFPGFEWPLLLLFMASLLLPYGRDVITINGAHHPALDFLFGTITQLGDGLIFLPLIMILLFVRLGYALLATVVWAGHGLICLLLKRVFFFGWPRPIEVVDSNLLHFVPNITVHHFHSFPSGHTATAFCFAVLAAMLLRHKGVAILLAMLALLVGYSRVYLLQHFLWDVAAGAFIGVVSTSVAWRAYHQRQWPAWMSSFIQVKLGRKRWKSSKV